MKALRCEQIEARKEKSARFTTEVPRGDEHADEPSEHYAERRKQI